MATRGPRKPAGPTPRFPAASRPAPTEGPVAPRPSAVWPEEPPRSGLEGEASPAVPFDDGSGRVGDERLAPADFAAMSELAATRHVFIRMATLGEDRPGELNRLCALLGACEVRRARRVLAHLLRAERLVDIYPLELVDALVEAGARAADGWQRQGLVQNRRFLESRIFGLDEVLDLDLPLAARVTGFAVAAGPKPGYHLWPGPPGRYHLELGAAGRYRILIGGRMRGMDILEALHLWVE